MRDKEVLLRHYNEENAWLPNKEVRAFDTVKDNCMPYIYEIISTTYYCQNYCYSRYWQHSSFARTSLSFKDYTVGTFAARRINSKTALRRVAKTIMQ